LDFGVPSSQAVPPVPSPKLGWMVSGLAIDPFNSDHMLYGTGATIYGSNDLTNWDKGTPIHISVAAAGLEEMAVPDLNSTPAGASNIGFTFATGSSWFGGNGSFSTNSGGGTVAAAADASRVVWAPTNNAAPVSFSTDNGNSWTSSTGIPQGAIVHSDRVNAS